VTLALALGFMGAVALAGAIGLFAQSLRARGGIIAEATIVDREITRTYDAAVPAAERMLPTAAPVVEFTDAQGMTHRVTSSLGGARLPAIGTRVRVSYRSDHPERAVVLDVPGQAPAKWVFLVVGLACLAGAIIVAVH
jgi:Protein of unknown function (DUF3592)